MRSRQPKSICPKVLATLLIGDGQIDPSDDFSQREKQRLPAFVFLPSGLAGF